MMNQRVRVRFAPSPTGPLHIGGVRTALFNYLFAKQKGGDFVLRIEDTDSKRWVSGAEEYISESLNWCGLKPDESPVLGGNYGPYRQSERKHIYKKYIQVLLENGSAYYAFDTPEDLEKHRIDHEKKGKTFIYNWHNRLKLSNSLTLSKEEINTKLQNGTPYVIRFKMPESGIKPLNDLIRGSMEIDLSLLDDKVLFKSDGMPTYHFANVVDDHLMEISHVIRGEEWLPSMALHFLLYEAFGWQRPEFAHLPLILKPTGKGKLSKRDGEKFGFPVFPINWEDSNAQKIWHGFKEKGYFSEALVNFLAFLGWNPGSDEEFFTLEELVSHFQIDRVNKDGAKFNIDKANWFNHRYLQQYNDKELATELKSSHAQELEDFRLDFIEKAVALVKERAYFLSEIYSDNTYFFAAPQHFDEKAINKAIKPQTPDLFESFVTYFKTFKEMPSEAQKGAIKSWIKEKGIGFGQIMMPLRIALVGALKGPDVFDIMELLGFEESLKRMENLQSFIG